MATFTIAVQISPFNQLGDELRLFVGTENMATLELSTPAGGKEVASSPCWPGGGGDQAGAGRDGAGLAPAGLNLCGYQANEGEGGMGPAGWSQTPRRLIVDTYTPTDKCACLPVGVSVVDAAGNVSPLDEQLVPIADPPIGARNLAASPTGNAGEVQLTWSQSVDVT